jgi:riboflavin synthase
MFTGIISNIGHVVGLSKQREALVRISTDYDADTIALGSSIACSGACLTVIDSGKSEGKDWFSVQVSEESLSVTTLKNWRIGSSMNLERALKVGDELGGHFVTGHIDAVAKIQNYERINESMVLQVSIPEGLHKFIAPKGSVTLDGVSLTVNKVFPKAFEVNIIPHTQKYTTLGERQIGDLLNLEIDPIARYIQNHPAAENYKLLNHA